MNRKAKKGEEAWGFTEYKERRDEIKQRKLERKMQKARKQRSRCNNLEENTYDKY